MALPTEIDISTEQPAQAEIAEVALSPETEIAKETRQALRQGQEPLEHIDPNNPAHHAIIEDMRAVAKKHDYSLITEPDGSIRSTGIADYQNMLVSKGANMPVDGKFGVLTQRFTDMGIDGRVEALQSAASDAQEKWLQPNAHFDAVANAYGIDTAIRYAAEGVSEDHLVSSSPVSWFHDRTVSSSETVGPNGQSISLREPYRILSRAGHRPFQNRADVNAAVRAGHLESVHGIPGINVSSGVSVPYATSHVTDLLRQMGKDALGAGVGPITVTSATRLTRYRSGDLSAHRSGNAIDFRYRPGTAQSRFINRFVQDLEMSTGTVDAGLHNNAGGSGKHFHVTILPSVELALAPSTNNRPA